MEKVIVESKSDIKITKNYSSFKRLKGNRKLYPKHIKMLADAFKGKPDVLSYNPVVVNEKMQVIDGQHRIEAARKADIPVYYIMHKNLKLKDVQALNSGTKAWAPMDYALSYMELGKLDYQLYVDIAEDSPFSHDILRFVLSGGRCNIHMFKSGGFQMWNTLRATDFLDRTCDFKDFYKAYTDKTFVMAFYKVYFKDNGRTVREEYNHEYMLQQLTKEPNVINNWFEVADYLRELEAIYNSGLKDEHKVRFF